MSNAASTPASDLHVSSPFNDARQRGADVPAVLLEQAERSRVPVYVHPVGKAVFFSDCYEQSGFHIDELNNAYLPGPRPMTYTYQGFAHAQ